MFQKEWVNVAPSQFVVVWHVEQAVGTIPMVDASAAR
jgi:hypothetical protein